MMQSRCPSCGWTGEPADACPPRGHPLTAAAPASRSDLARALGALGLERPEPYLRIPGAQEREMRMDRRIAHAHAPGGERETRRLFRAHLKSFRR